MSPLSGQRADELVQFVSTHTEGTILDIECGRGALLIHLLRANSAICGIGLALNASGFDHAVQIATALGVADRLQLLAEDAKTHLPSSADGAICIGVTQVWSQHAEANMPLNCSVALSALRKSVAIGAPIVDGEGILSRPSTEAAAAPLAGRLDEFVFLTELVEIA